MTVSLVEALPPNLSTLPPTDSHSYQKTLFDTYEQIMGKLKPSPLVKPLFSMQNSDITIQNAVDELNAAKPPVPADLALQFHQAGYPLPAQWTITTPTDGTQGMLWDVQVTLPQGSTTYRIKLDRDWQQLHVYGLSDNPVLLLQYYIDLFDDLLSKGLSTVLHSPDFQTLEASWRGLQGLVNTTEAGELLKLRLLNATRKEIQDDLDNAVDFDQSQLFKKIYEQEYGMFGGVPYSALLTDFSFGRQPQDVTLLQNLAGVAAAAHAPLIASSTPDLFGLQSFTDLDKPRDIGTIFESAELIKWSAFRASEDSRYVALTLPRMLMRLPYDPIANPVAGFNFVEDMITPAASDPAANGANGSTKSWTPLPSNFLWGSSAWALGQCITNAFALYHWTAAIRGYEGGGLVNDLPIYTYTTDDGDIGVAIPTEVAITDRREKELSDQGFLALCYRKNTDQAAFFGGQTTNKPKVYFDPQATANARLSSELPYILVASRFAHYIKVMMRDKIGSFLTEGEVSAYLNSWISQYVLLNDDAGQETKARYPLREAQVTVTADPSRPGCYKAVVFLRPHFQLEELTVSIRLVASLPAPAA